jgi:formylglycine-generating enzyme required for sulfatase activity/tRNA A-37 threonylcarbamoyl transferase component Bud32
MTLDVNTTLQDRYKVLRPLGEGGMGAAYLVADTRLNRQCVIKEVLHADTTHKAQFEREAQLLARLQHPHLPVVYDYFFDQGHPYLVMQYVPGTTLDRRRDQRNTPFEPDDVLGWAQDILDALRYIHAHPTPIIHRDIKPANVCITPQGDAVLLDFGIARPLDQHRTRTAAQAFSQGYTPIEQYPEATLRNMPTPLAYVQALHQQGIHTGPYSDIYGLSATLYYALTLSPPPDACMRVLGERLPAVQDKNAETPGFLAEAIMKGLALDPRERFPSAAAMLAALQPEATQSSPVRLARRAPRPLPTGDVQALDHALIHIPAGSFTMGSDDPQVKDAGHPQHRVALGAYAIARAPVTQREYARFIADNPDYPVPHSPMRFAQPYNWDRRRRTPPKGLEEHPVVLVTWEDARAYCAWLREVTGYPCRLPTEAEWEKAARWDPKAEWARRYPWGEALAPDEDKTRANVDAHGALRLATSPVGQYSPQGDSPYGLVDMAGNVWEWTGSLYRPYPYDADDGREAPDAGGERVVRGGAYDEGPLLARCAWRNGVKPDLRLANIGFRVACDAE